MLPIMMMPASLSVTARVEKATSHLLMIPDWAMNMNICDAINTDPLHAKDFVKAVKKRLQHKNPRVQFLALMLLETMIKNCGDYVHSQVVDREILPEMVKTVRRTADIQVRDKILVLLDSWQEVFGGAGGNYPQYYYAYAELKTSGIRFPEHQKDAALIYTPATQSYHPESRYGAPSNSMERHDEAVGNEILSLSDLKNIQSVMELFIDMLRAVNTEDRAAVEDEVIMDLTSQCRINQKRLMQLINSTENEMLLGEALALFENLQNALAKHDAIASGSPLPSDSTHTISKPAILSPLPSTIQNQDNREPEDESSSLHRDSKLKLSSDIDITTPISSSAVSEPTESVISNALVPIDPPTSNDTFKSINKEEDMIDLLSLVLSTDPPPQTSSSVPQSNLDQNPFSSSPSSQQYTSNPQPLVSNSNNRPHSSYVAPWAQSQSSFPHPQVPQHTYSYQNPSWTPGVSSNNPFLSPSSFQFPSIQPPVAPANAAQHAAMTPATSFQSAYSQSAAAPAPAIPVNPILYTPQATMAPGPPAFSPVQDSMAIQKFTNAMGSREVQVNMNNLKQAAASKPYVSPDKLFEGLLELRNPDGSLKSRNASTLWNSTGDGVAGGRK